MTLVLRRHAVARIGLGLLLSLVVIPLYSGIGHTQKPLGEGNWPAHYPVMFDGRGNIDRIENDQLVLDDSLHYLSSDVECSTPTGANVSIAEFAVGDYVGYKTNPEHKITSLWLLKKAKP